MKLTSAKVEVEVEKALGKKSCFRHLEHLNFNVEESIIFMEGGNSNSVWKIPLTTRNSAQLGLEA